KTQQRPTPSAPKNPARRRVSPKRSSPTYSCLRGRRTIRGLSQNLARAPPTLASSSKDPARALPRRKACPKAHGSSGLKAAPATAGGTLMELFDALTLARLQFAFTMSFHIVFPAFTIGLASYLAVLEGLWLATGRTVFLAVYNYWKKIFA